MSTISPFKSIQNVYSHDVYRGKESRKKFCESLRKRTMDIINFKRKKEFFNKRAAGII